MTFKLTPGEDDTYVLSYTTGAPVTQPTTEAQEETAPPTEPETEEPTSDVTVPAPGKTVTVCIISYLMDELGDEGWQLHYWNDDSLAGDINLVKTEKIVKKALGEAYWNNEPQIFTVFLANDVPATATGYKVHNGERWFGADGSTEKLTVYVYNYDGDKAYYDDGELEPVTEPVTEPTEKPTEAPTEPTQEPTEPATVDFYLFGYINGANYACEEDAENMGEYKFVNGALTATFTEDSYVAVKTTGNANWYMTKGFLGTTETAATLYNTTALGEEANKLFVPGKMEVTFALTPGKDADTYILSYTVKEPATEPLLGDVNLDGSVTIDDATMLQRYLTEMVDLTDEQLRNADVNKDNRVDIRDVTEIQRYLANIITAF